MKTPEELNAIKAEVESMNKKLTELTAEELTQVSGGWTDEELYQMISSGLPRNENGIPMMSDFCPHCRANPVLFVGVNHGYFYFRCTKDSSHTWYTGF